MGLFVTLKKNQVKNMDLKKQGAKNWVIVIQKEKRHGFFQIQILDLIFFLSFRP